MVYWSYRGKEVRAVEDMPEGSIGFIYVIRLLDGSGRYYIGRKELVSRRKKKLTKKEKEKTKTRKTFKYVESESNWKKYTGSSIELNALLKKEKPPYEKEIITYCFTKSQLTYEETREIICSGSLMDDKSFNGWMRARIFKKHLI